MDRATYQVSGTNLSKEEIISIFSAVNKCVSFIRILVAVAGLVVVCVVVVVVVSNIVVVVVTVVVFNGLALVVSFSF